MRSSYGREPSGATRRFLTGAVVAGNLGSIFSPVAAVCAAVSHVAFNTSAGHVRYAVASLAVSFTIAIGASIARRFTTVAGDQALPALAGFALSGALILQGANVWSSQWEEQLKADAPAEAIPACTPHN